MATRLHRLFLTSTALLALGTLPSAAGPNGGTVVGGTATISGQGSSSVVVNQTSNSAIINWQTFNIGAGQTTTFVQPSSSSVALNRVVGGQGPSEILGSLIANGKVFLVNRDGFLFGSGAVINTASFLATTSDIANEDFMAGKYNFSIPGNPNASIVNLGTITAANTGFAALVAPGVRNAGTISATLGTVTLASGNAFTLDFYGDKLITLALGDQIAEQVRDVQTGETLKSLVSNEGTISANGGRVELTAAAARQVVDSVINNTGVIEANSVGTKNGMIVLGAATADSKPADAPKQTIKLAGKISAAGKDKGTTGGTVVASAEDIQLTGAQIDVSGSAGGGKVLIGGDWGGGKPTTSVSNQSATLETFAIPTATTVSVDSASTINASAIDSGNGGKVILWSDAQTTFSGAILARGGAQGGNGGFVETSSHGVLAFNGTVDTLAPYGTAGTLLLDPYDLTICETDCQAQVSNLDGVITPTGDSSFLAADTIVTALGTGNVTISTGSGDSSAAGNINVNASITWSSNTTLTLSAYNDINIAPGRVISNTYTAVSGPQPQLILRADNSGSGQGTVNFISDCPTCSTGQVDFSKSTGAVSIYYNPSVNPANSEVNPNSYVNPTENYSNYVTGNMTAYMLVNTANDLQNMQNNLSGNYALGGNIDATGFIGFNNIGATFNGRFDGSGGLGVNYTISNLNLTAPSNGGNGNSYGLFPFIGTGGDVRNLNLANVTINAGDNMEFLGALAGTNAGTISNVAVLSGSVNSGLYSGIIAGGLVGQNGSFTNNNANEAPGSITRSFANVNVTVGDSVNCQGPNCSGSHSSAGGLVGFNSPNSTITDSIAIGDVTAGAGSDAGGLIGQNFGTIGSTISPSTSSECLQGGSYSCAAGQVYVGTGGNGGGLVGSNDGTLENVFATSTVTGASGSPNSQQGNSQTQLGGLVGNNQGTISYAFATGVVGSADASDLQVGGLVGQNHGLIEHSFAIELVQAGDNSQAGGLTGNNDKNDCNGGCNGGFVGVGDNNSGTIIDSWASSYVTVGSASLAGGVSGTNNGTISYASALGSVVTGGANSILGGLVGGVGAGKGPSSIDHSVATNVVVTGGDQSTIGGLVGASAGTITSSTASGFVIGTSDSFLGGLVGVNVGLIMDSSSSATVTGIGGQNFAGGLVGLNFGGIDPSSSSGSVTSGDNSIVGGLVGANGAFSNNFSLPSGTIAGSFPIGTVSSDSIATGTATGGSGSTVGAQIGENYPTSYPSSTSPYPSLIYNTGSCNDPICTILATGTLTDPNPSTTTTTTDPQQQVIQNLVQDVILASLPGDVVDTQGLTLPPKPPSAPGASGPTSLPPQFGAKFFTPPPLDPSLYVQNQVVVQIPSGIPLSQLQGMFSQLGLTVQGSQTLGLLGTTAYQLHINNGSSVGAIIQALARFQVNAGAQANLIFHTTQDSPAPASAPTSGAEEQEGDDAQYIVGKLHLPDVHRLLKGTNVPIAVIDSEIDAKHPDLDGAIVESYDAVGTEEKPHPHGTGMAGAIASHRRVLGMAPAAHLFAVHAFSNGPATAESTTFQILKGIDWSVSHGARVINMSFAGPRDPSLERALKNAHDKGVVLVAAAGNAGPKSPPLYPGADPHVIAVTATDVNDKLFTGANRGKYVAVAAPGVDILVPAPDASYQLTTGTSVASAEVSGIVALLLERNPKLTPDDVRRILTSSAKRLGPQDRNDDYGSGLVDPLKALESAGGPPPRSAEQRTPATIR